MNGKEMKVLLPLAVVVVIILSIFGIAVMRGPKEEEKEKEELYILIVGPITDPDGNDLDAAIISLKSGNETLATEVTNTEGMATFSFNEKIEEGEYTLVVTKEGYDDTEVEVTLGIDGNTIELSGIDLDGIKLKLPISRVSKKDGRKFTADFPKT